MHEACRQSRRLEGPSPKELLGCVDACSPTNKFFFSDTGLARLLRNLSEDGKVKEGMSRWWLQCPMSHAYLYEYVGRLRNDVAAEGPSRVYSLVRVNCNKPKLKDARLFAWRVFSDAWAMTGSNFPSSQRPLRGTTSLSARHAQIPSALFWSLSYYLDYLAHAP